MRDPAERSALETGMEPSRETTIPLAMEDVKQRAFGGKGSSLGVTELKGLHCRRLPERSVCIRAA